MSVIKYLHPGDVIGSGARSCQIERVTLENIYIRMPTEKGSSRKALRIIPVVVVDEIFKAVINKDVSLDDISRQFRSDSNEPHLFDTLNLEFDKYILGYKATIQKLCEHVLDRLNLHPSL